ncbi:BglG family transcription antiterminator [Oceanobacillus timonensis]|uniref:BglG family transcription antiterminator n=1 Tax=Oceanobacillus timonensis TaxID=1926285 RepID=UPI0009B97DE4|nr:PRD domain-containing protein [Oceanobacillus timonensis]
MFDITVRQAKLIQLMSDKEEYMPANYYANILNVSERTIFNDIANLEDEFNCFDIKFERKPNRGIRLSGDVVTSNLFYQQLLKNNKLQDNILYSALNRQILIVKWLLLENKILTYQFLSMELYVSTTSIMKDIDQIKRFIGDDVFLISDVKGTRIKGSEIGIQKSLKRFAYYVIKKQAYNYSIFSYVKELALLFDENVINHVEQTMKDMISVLDRDISEQYLKSLFIFLIILTERSSKGYHIKDIPMMDWERYETLTDYPLAVQICQQITSNMNFEFTDLEIQYISNQLFAHRVQVKINNKYIESFFSGDVQDMISKVSFAMGINLNSDERLYNSLIYHMFPMIYRMKTGVIIYNPLSDDIKRNYGILFQIVWYAIENFEKKYDIKLSDDDVTFITIYFQVAIERKTSMRKILVVCQTGMVTSDLIMNRIKKMLPANIHFKLIAKPMLDNEDISNVDFIISSVDLKEISIPTVYVSPVVSDEDLINIYRSYLKYSTTEQEEPIQESYSDEVSAYLDRKYLFLNEEPTDKQECLNTMINSFERNGIVTSEFKQSVFEREELGNTLVQSWIAAPHGEMTTVKETKIAVMSTRQPVKWNDESQVSLIILLAVAEKDMGKIRKLLGNMFRNILQLESMESEVKTFTDLEQLIQLFKK